MKPLLLIAGMLLVWLDLKAAPADTNPPPRLTVELRDGSRVIGTSVADQFRFHSDLLGGMKLKVADIRSVNCASSNSAEITTVNGDLIKGSIEDSEFAVKTSFGAVKLPVDSIRKFTVTATGVNVPRHAGLMGFWAANGNADDSVAGNNGQLMGGADYASGPAGQTFNFDAPGSFVKIPKSPALDPGSQVTVEFWMKVSPGNGMNNYQGLVTSDFYGVEISNGYGGNLGVNFFLSTMAGQPPVRNGRGIQGFNGVTTVANFTHVSDANGGGASVSAGEWHQVAATYDSRQLKLYIDGKLWGRPMFHSGSIPPMLSDSFVAIGSEDGRMTCPDCIGTRYFKGQISRVAIYKRALSPAEVQEDYEAGMAE